MQLAAVQHDAGPLVVLAGPGTGKTRVITHRVAHALLARGVQPEHVLACTFTVAAARELRERLVPLVGAGSAARVRANTLHAFGARLVSRFRGPLGLPARTTLLDRVGQRRLLAEVVVRDGLFDAALQLSLRHRPPTNNESNSDAPPSEADEQPPPPSASRGIEGLDALLERIEKATEAIANAGLLPSEALAQAQRHVQRVQAAQPLSDAVILQAEDALLLARTNDAFCRERWSRGLLTFADFQLLPILGLEKLPYVASLTRADVRCIVVDEFQDCNPAQVRLLSLLAGPAARTPDICVVGDDDQGIYAFRGASDRAFDLFEKLYPAPKVLTLADNHRSTDAIVQVANHTISLASHRFRPDKSIRSARGAPAGLPERVELLTYEGQAGFVAAAAAQAVLERDRARTMGTPLLDEFAIITKTNREAMDIASLLRAHNVPHIEPAPPPPLSHPAAQATLAWARFLLSDLDAASALDVLRSPPWSLPATVAAALFSLHRELDAAHARALQAGEARTRVRPRFVSVLRTLCEPRDERDASPLWSDGLLRALDEAGLSESELRATLASVLQLRDSLRATALSSPASEALGAIIQAVDPIHAGLPDGREQAARVRAVVSLLSVARAKQPRLPAPGTLATFLAYLDELLALDSDLRDLRATQLDDDAPEEFAGTGIDVPDASDPQPASAQPSRAAEGRVSILTAHASKGLEFGTVVVPRVTPQHGYGATRARSDDEALPDGLLPFGEDVPVDADEAAKRAADESRRLFYVACTRAKHRLVLLGPKLKGKSKSQNHFFQELSNASATLPIIVAQAPLGLAGDGEHQPVTAAALAAAGLAPSNAPQRKQGMMQTVRAQLARALDALLGTGSDTGEAPEMLVARARALASPDPLAAARALGAGHEKFVQSMQDMVGQATQPAGIAMQMPRMPLHLSYSSLEMYADCPRCWYVKHVMRLPDAETQERTVGNATHAALEAFYREWQTADSEGAALPGLERLLALGAQAWRQQATSGSEGEAGTADLAQIRALLTNAHSKLHSERDHVLEVEQHNHFAFEVDGIAHSFDAKIDRVDQLPSGGLRVIDYKTGHPRKTLLTPEPTDMQLAIYAMALLAADPKLALDTCVGEYWLLRTGQRGTIRFSDFDLAGVREEIAGMVRQIARGEFGAKKGCERGLCAFVPDGVFQVRRPQ